MEKGRRKEETEERKAEAKGWERRSPSDFGPKLSNVNREYGYNISYNDISKSRSM